MAELVPDKNELILLEVRSLVIGTQLAAYPRGPAEPSSIKEDPLSLARSFLASHFRTDWLS